MTQSPIAVVDDTRFDRHRAPGYHPERPERLPAVRHGLEAAVPPDAQQRIDTREASDEELERIHPRSYLDHLRATLSGGWGHLDPDTYYGPESGDAAWLAAGGGVALVRQLVRNDPARGVALLRPPGHHARPETAMGFCLFNNIAIAAADALAQGVERVAIFDWDVHHGNGTQEAFYDDPRLLFISMHQWPFYPGSGRVEEIGRGPGTGSTINLPLPAGTRPPLYGEALRTLVLPVLRAFEPGLVLVSMGFDAHANDPLAGLELDDATFAAMTTALCDLVGELGHGRLGLFLEGGYDLDALQSSMEAVGHALRGTRTELPTGEPSPDARKALDDTRARIAPYWPALQ